MYRPDWGHFSPVRKNFWVLAASFLGAVLLLVAAFFGLEVVFGFTLEAVFGFEAAFLAVFFSGM